MELVNLDKYERLMFRLGFCGDDEELFYVFTPGNNVALLSKPIGVAQGVLHSVVLSNASFPGHIFYVGNNGAVGGNITHVDPHSRSLEEALGYLADVVNRRLVGQNRGHPILVALDSIHYTESDPRMWWDFTYIGRYGRSSNLAVLFCGDDVDLPLPFSATAFVYNAQTGYFTYRENGTYDFKPANP